MKPEQQRIAIAEACGWENIAWFKLHAGNEDYWGTKYIGVDEYATRHRLPEYLNDLNVMHEVEKMLGEKGLVEQLMYLHFISPVRSEWSLATATAAQRAEAFLKTLDRWTDE